MFFGYVYFVMVVLIQPLFELTGANPLFRDTCTGILNVALMTFQYMGFNEFFANNAPTFGTYWYASWARGREPGAGAGAGQVI